MYLHNKEKKVPIGNVLETITNGNHFGDLDKTIERQNVFVIPYQRGSLISGTDA